MIKTVRLNVVSICLSFLVHAHFGALNLYYNIVRRCSYLVQQNSIFIGNGWTKSRLLLVIGDYYYWLLVVVKLLRDEVLPPLI